VRRALVLLVVVSAVVGLAVTSTRARVKVEPAAVAVAGAWGSPQALVPVSQYASDPQLAVSEPGAMLAAWYGGTEPRPATAKGSARVSSGRPPAARQASSGSSVLIDTGTVSGGFGAPSVLAEHGANTESGLDVAISGSGVRYVAWQTSAGGWMIASAAPGEGFTAHVLPVPLERLLESPAGPVAAVWHPGAARLHYALLTAGGELGHVVNVPGRFRFLAEPLALNDRGAFAAVENTAEDGAGTGPPPHPVASLCEPSGHCMAPHPLKLGHPPSGSEENDAVALSDAGTLTVLAAFSKAPRNPAANTPWGLWDSTRRPGGRWSAPQEISTGGELPLAASDGKDSAVTVFQHFWTPKLHWLRDRIEISVLHARASRFAAPDLVRGEEAPEPAALATKLSGGLLVAWINSGGIVGGEHTEPGLYAVTGSATDPGAPKLVTGAEVSGETPAVGIDRDGRGVILWTGSAQTPPRNAGVFASVFGVQ
jgi:hypothetical protein